MPRRGEGKLYQFLWNNLNNQSFDERLKWIDKPELVFQMVWNHGNGGSWSEQDVDIFKAWDEFKHRPSVNNMLTKQRFRSAMNKMKIKEVAEWKNMTPPKHYRFKKFDRDELAKIKPKERSDQQAPDSDGDWVASSDNESRESSDTSPPTADLDLDPAEDLFPPLPSEPSIDLSVIPTGLNPVDNFWQNELTCSDPSAIKETTSACLEVHNNSWDPFECFKGGIITEVLQNLPDDGLLSRYVFEDVSLILEDEQSLKSRNDMELELLNDHFLGLVKNDS